MIQFQQILFRFSHLRQLHCFDTKTMSKEELAGRLSGFATLGSALEQRTLDLVQSLIDNFILEAKTWFQGLQAYQQVLGLNAKAIQQRLGD